MDSKDTVKWVLRHLLLLFFLIRTTLQPYIDMKKNILLCTLAGIACFSAGFCMNQIMHSNDTELIDAQNACLEQAEKVMWNNELFDTDGSDDMADYLNLAFEVDSLHKTNL